MPSIEILHRPDPELFRREFVDKRRPVILRGVTDDWDVMRWTPEYLAENFPDAPVEYEVWHDDCTDDIFDFKDREVGATESMAAFVARIRQSGKSRKYYAADFSIFRTLPELKSATKSLEAYMCLPAIVPKPVSRACLIWDPRMWMGPGGTHTPLHFDRRDNLTLQVYGKKRWLYISPDQSDNLYWPCADLPRGMLHYSPVDLESFDPRRFPKTTRVEPIELIMEPGDLVFTPAHWWHEVRSLETSITFNFLSYGSRMLGRAHDLRKFFYYRARRMVLETLGLRSVIRMVEQ
jgi:lysine-specific demethylase 8